MPKIYPEYVIIEKWYYIFRSLERSEVGGLRRRARYTMDDRKSLEQIALESDNHQSCVLI